ncbi:MAG: DUF3794 domain-containing protein [Clostridia bacterium]|nr:DUF3794 domain-containing protein [Clostridia bacterium]
MDMNNPTTLTSVSCLTTLTHDSAEDFTLPDYMPEIRRVLAVEAVPLPESRFLTGAAMEFGGTVIYSVLYLGDTGEIYSAPLSSEYSASVALGDASVTDAAAVGIDTHLDSVTCRASGPRKLSLKSRLKTGIAAYRPDSLTEIARDSATGRSVEDAPVERLVYTAPNVQIARGEITSTASGTVSVAAGTKVIACRGAIRPEEVRSASDGVSVRGDAVLHMLCLSPEGKLFCTAAKTPISELIPVSGAGEGDPCRAWGRSAAVTVNTTDPSAVSWEIEYDMEAECVRPEETSYTADAYATSCASSTETAEHDSLRLIKCGIGALSFSGESGRQSKAVAGEYVIRADAAAAVDRVEMGEGKKLIFHGNCGCRVLLAADGEVIAEEFAVPFRYETEAFARPESADLLWRCSAETVDVAARTEGDKIAVGVDLSLSMSVLSREKIRAVTAVVLDRSAPVEGEDGVVRICYPDAGESVWEIGKRYRADLHTLCRRNGLADPASLCGGEPILI